MKSKPFTGTFTALVTPFTEGKLDESALKTLVLRQVRAGVDGIVPVGTTGESPTLDVEEHLRVVELAVRFTAGRIRVVAGTGANSTDEAVYLSKEAAKLGVDGLLQVAPYYNKPSQEGLFQHFGTIARSTRLPIILYSIPGRCGVAIEVETTRRLARRFKNIVAIKEAGGDADRVSQLRQACGPDFTLLSGDDALTLPFMAVGASGVISVASNLIPREVARMVRAFAGGDPNRALKIHDKYYALFKDLFIETNPTPVKAALSLMGLADEEVRLPLVSIGIDSRRQLGATLKRCGLLK